MTARGMKELGRLLVASEGNTHCHVGCPWEENWAMALCLHSGPMYVVNLRDHSEKCPSPQKKPCSHT